MIVLVNGDELQLPDGSRLEDAIAKIVGDDTRGVAVALDGQVVRRDAWSTPLKPGQHVEVLRATAGG